MHNLQLLDTFFRAGEVKVLDYQTQQHRIFPQIARGVAFKLSDFYIMKLYTQTMEDIKNGDVRQIFDQLRKADSLIE